MKGNDFFNARKHLLNLLSANTFVSNRIHDAIECMTQFSEKAPFFMPHTTGN